jgi:hypothetical protein
MPFAYSFNCYLLHAFIVVILIHDIKNVLIYMSINTNIC